MNSESKREMSSEINRLLDEKKYVEAKKLIDVYEKTSFYDAELFALKANMFFCMGKTADAEFLINQGLKIDSSNLSLNYYDATLAEQNGNYARALDCLQKCLHLAEDEPTLAQIHLKINKLSALIKTSFKINFKQRLVIGSPICQKPSILKEFLNSLIELEKSSTDIAYCFIDDNENEDSSKLLAEFEQKVPNVLVYNYKSSTSYLCDDTTHHWNDRLIWKVADLKNLIIKIALQNRADYLFLIDSDIMLHPKALEHLVSCNKDILSQVFWTQWQPDTLLQPQVWLYDHYTQCYLKGGESPTSLGKNEYDQRMRQFFEMLKQPGTYEVGGLGACTLVSKKALEAGVNFSQLNNVTFWGEDRHFCLRAAALGFSLHADTHYPAYHIYRESHLSGVEAFKRQCGYHRKNAPPEIQVNSNEFAGKNTAVAGQAAPPTSAPKITLSMVMKNEAKRYLPRVLAAHKDYIDTAVIIDDGSTDASISLCKKILSDIDLHIVKNNQSMFSNEITLRKLQWEETLKTNPEWILNLDADEIFEEQFKYHVKALVGESDVYAYCFRLYDFWAEEEYREDKYWSAHAYYRPFLIKYDPAFRYQWNEQPQHCGRMPHNILALPWKKSELRLKHLGWAKKSDRIAKYKRYQALDPNAVYGIKEQYESILDKNPRLLKWVE